MDVGLYYMMGLNYRDEMKQNSRGKIQISNEMNLEGFNVLEKSSASVCWEYTQESAPQEPCPVPCISVQENNPIHISS